MRRHASLPACINMTVQLHTRVKTSRGRGYAHQEHNFFWLSGRLCSPTSAKSHACTLQRSIHAFACGVNRAAATDSAGSGVPSSMSGNDGHLPNNLPSHCHLLRSQEHECRVRGCRVGGHQHLLLCETASMCSHAANYRCDGAVPLAYGWKPQEGRGRTLPNRFLEIGIVRSCDF